MTEKISLNQNSSNETNSNDTNNLLITSIEQIDSIINKNLHLFNGDYERLKKKSDEQEFTIVKLKQDLNIIMKQSNDIQTMFIQIHDTLVMKSRLHSTFIYISFLICRSISVKN